MPTLIPTTFKDSEDQLQVWKAKILILLSSPSHKSYQNWIAGTEDVLVTGQLQELDFTILQQQVIEQREQRSKSRHTL
jgi:hypothetical protein